MAGDAGALTLPYKSKVVIETEGSFCKDCKTHSFVSSTVLDKPIDESEG